jgi:hypothetical protein
MGGIYKISVCVERITLLPFAPVVFLVVALLTKCLQVIPRKRNVRIVYILLRQIDFVVCDLRNNRIVGRGTSFAKIALRLQEAFTTRAPRVRIIELFSPCLHACRLLSGNKKALTGEPAKACEVRCLFAFNQRNNYSIYGRYTQGRETGAKRAFFGLF